MTLSAINRRALSATGALGAAAVMFTAPASAQQSEPEPTTLITHVNIFDGVNEALIEGPRSPYRAGPVGVIREGAYADLVLVNGTPLEDIDLVSDPEESFALIMKDGIIYKNTSQVMAWI